MKKPEYLISALSDGLMFTEHRVEFAPTKNREEMHALLQIILPHLEYRLNALGKPLNTLPAERQKAIFMGLGNISSHVPMLCFSEVPKGRDVKDHRDNFGRYGLIISKNWVEANNGERIIYVGENSPLSRQLFLNLAALKIYSLQVSASGDVLFDDHALQLALNLFVFFEERSHLHQFEWRIVGNTGFTGGKRSTGTRLPLPIDAVEGVFVSSEEEVPAFEKLLDNLSGGQAKPPVLVFPDGSIH